MFAYRTTWIVKRGCMQKALELLDTEAKRQGKSADWTAVRVYTPNISPNALVFEMVWENKEAHDTFWPAYWGSPEGQAFYAQWDEVVERSTGTELWNVKEWR